MTKHRLRCEKSFRPKANLEPSPTDCDIPLKKTKKQLAQASAQQARAATRGQVQGKPAPPPLQPRPVGGAILNTSTKNTPTVAQAISQVRPRTHRARSSAAQRQKWKMFHSLHRAAAPACCVNTLLGNSCFQNYLCCIMQILRCALCTVCGWGVTSQLLFVLPPPHMCFLFRRCCKVHKSWSPLQKKVKLQVFSCLSRHFIGKYASHSHSD